MPHLYQKTLAITLPVQKKLVVASLWWSCSMHTIILLSTILIDDLWTGPWHVRCLPVTGHTCHLLLCVASDFIPEKLQFLIWIEYPSYDNGCSDQDTDWRAVVILSLHSSVLSMAGLLEMTSATISIYVTNILGRLKKKKHMHFIDCFP